MDKSDFKVMVKRLPGYEPSVAMRFEMNEGYGELLVGEARRAAPSAAGDVSDVTGEQVRAGRFVHVLASGRRRQSYSLSRLDDDRLQRLPDDRWTDLTPSTEFGIRYLDMPDLAPAPVVAAVQVAAAAPARSAASAPVDIDSRTGTPTLARARGSSVQPAPRRTAEGVPPRVATPAGPTGPVTIQAPVSIERSLGEDAIKRLSTDELRKRLLDEMNKVGALIHENERLQNELFASQDRERDLIDLIARWQERG